MNTIPSNFFFILILLLNVLIIYFPNFFFKKDELVRGRKLKDNHPKFAWLRRGFPLCYIAFLAIFILLPMALNKVFPKTLFIIWYMNFFAALGGFFGFFSIVSQVLILPSRGPRLQYAFGLKASIISVIQFFSSLVLILFNSAILYIFVRPAGIIP